MRGTATHVEGRIRLWMAAQERRHLAEAGQMAASAPAPHEPPPRGAEAEAAEG